MLRRRSSIFLLFFLISAKNAEENISLNKNDAVGELNITTENISVTTEQTIEGFTAEGLHVKSEKIETNKTNKTNKTENGVSFIEQKKEPTTSATTAKKSSQIQLRNISEDETRSEPEIETGRIKGPIRVVVNTPSYPYHHYHYTTPYPYTRPPHHHHYGGYGDYGGRPPYGGYPGYGYPGYGYPGYGYPGYGYPGWGYPGYPGYPGWGYPFNLNSTIVTGDRSGSSNIISNLEQPDEEVNESRNVTPQTPVKRAPFFSFLGFGQNRK